MTDYARIESAVRWATNSAFSNASVQGYTFDATTPTKYMHVEVTATLVGAGGYTLDLSAFATIQVLVVTNHDTTNFVTITYRTLADASAADNNQKIKAGRHCVLLEVTPGNDLKLVADTANCECDIYVIGA